MVYSNEAVEGTATNFSMVISPLMESALITHVSSHTKESAGVQTSTGEARINDITEGPSVACSKGIFWRISASIVLVATSLLSGFNTV